LSQSGSASFLLNTPQSSFNSCIDLDKFMQSIVNTGLINPLDYLNQIQILTKVNGGTAITHINHAMS
jgi:hypothetical protein